MNWEKIKVNHYFSRPVEYIYASAIFDLKEYDKLYENQNNLLHRLWQEFRSKYKLRLDQTIFHDDLQQINLDRSALVQQFINGIADGPVPFHFPANDYFNQMLSNVKNHEEDLGESPSSEKTNNRERHYE